VDHYMTYSARAARAGSDSQSDTHSDTGSQRRDRGKQRHDGGTQDGDTEDGHGRDERRYDGYRHDGHRRSDGAPGQQGPFDRVYIDPVYPYQAALRGQAVTVHQSLRHAMSQRRLLGGHSNHAADVNATKASQVNGQGSHKSVGQHQHQRLHEQRLHAGSAQEIHEEAQHPGMASEQHRRLQPQRSSQQRTKAARSQAKKSTGQSSKSQGNPPCPSVVLLGVDATPTWGLRPPTNFLGQ
jgi:hypothetical protein